jgi:hypothetical protein
MANDTAADETPARAATSSIVSRRDRRAGAAEESESLAPGMTSCMVPHGS